MKDDILHYARRALGPQHRTAVVLYAQAMRIGQAPFVKVNQITLAAQGNDEAEVYLDGFLQHSLSAYEATHRLAFTKAMLENNAELVEKLDTVSIRKRQAHA